MALHVYANGVVEWVVADSLADAKAVLREHYRNWDCGDESEADTGFERVPDDKVLSRDEGRGEPVKKTAAEWAASHGRGFLMTTEY